jgi:ABC-type bacteriocin/lantibiotic exporters, contain an N-terminal double-glycine peptidase domain
MGFDRAIGGAAFGNRLYHLEVAVASTAINLLALAMPLLLLQVYDRIIPNHSVGTITLLAIGVITALIAEALLRIARSSILGALATRFEIAMNTRAAAHLLGSDLASFEVISPGRHMERLAAVGQLREGGSGQNLLTLYDLPFVVLYLALIWMLGGLVVLVSLAGLVVLALAAIPASRAAREALQSSSVTDDERFNFLISALAGMTSLKMMSLERPVLRRYEELQERRLLDQRASFLANQRLSEISHFVIQLTTIGTIALGSLFVLEGQISVGGLSACTLLVGRFLQLAQNLILLSSRHQTAVVARARLGELFQLPQAPKPAGAADATKAEPHLVVENLHFTFGGEEVLRGASFDVRRGEVVGLVGANGSGKTTLLSLIAGLYQPSAGRITLGGAPLSSYSSDSLAQAITFVPQQETLFQGTILDNITMFRPELSDAAIAVAERTGLTELLLSLPLGFATPAGEGATEALPRGVAQRIALARALVHEPGILLFDDANSAVDDQGDQKLAQLLDSLRETCGVIIVSHRPSILKLADRICRLGDGKIDQVEGLLL